MKHVIKYTLLSPFLVFAFLALPSKVTEVEKAYAATLLDPGSMNMGTVAGRADFLRFLYFFVNGPSSQYTINGPPNGLLGIVNQLTGPSALGGGLASAGYTTCPDIPTTGSASQGIYNMTFAASAKTIPGHFGSDANSSFDKRVTVTRNGTAFMDAEFKCSTSSTVTSGYIRMTDDREFETYYQQDSSTNAVYMDFFMNYSTDGEKVFTRFITTDGQTYQIWLIRTVAASTNAGDYIGVEGNTSTNLVRVNSLNNVGLTNTVAISTAASNGGVSECISLSSNSNTTGCAASISDPAAGPIINSSSFSANIQNTANFTLTSLSR